MWLHAPWKIAVTPIIVLVWWIGLAFWKAESKLYRSRHYSASLEQFLPKESVRNGVRKRPAAAKSEATAGFSIWCQILTKIWYDNHWKALLKTNRLVPSLSEVIIAARPRYRSPSQNTDNINAAWSNDNWHVHRQIIKNWNDNQPTSYQHEHPLTSLRSVKNNILSLTLEMNNTTTYWPRSARLLSTTTICYILPLTNLADARILLWRMIQQ